MNKISQKSEPLVVNTMKKEIELIESRAEVKLLDTGRFVILILQFIGYLPLSIMNNQSLHIKWISAAGLIPFVILCNQAVFFWHFITLPDEAKRSPGWGVALGATEIYVVSAMAGLSSVSSVLFKIWGMLDVKMTLGFWKSNCKLMKQFVLQDFDIWKEYDPIFVQIKRNVWKMNLVYILLSIFNLLVSSYYPWTQCQEILTNDALSLLSKIWRITITISGSTMVAIQFLLHVEMSVWMMYFVQVYTGYMEMIARELSKLQLPMISLLYSTTIVAELQEKKISNCMELYHEVQRQIVKFNEFFKFKLGIKVLSCILNLLMCLFFILTWAIQGDPMLTLSVTIPTLVYAKELYHLGSDSTTLKVRAGEVLEEFHRVFELNIGSELKSKIQMFAMKISHSPPEISPGFFFTLDRHLITSILSGVTTYLVILLQIRSDDIKEVVKLQNTTSHQNL